MHGRQWIHAVLDGTIDPGPEALAKRKQAHDPRPVVWSPSFEQE
jgi:hypothetical protein